MVTATARTRRRWGAPTSAGDPVLFPLPLMCKLNQKKESVHFPFHDFPFFFFINHGSGGGETILGLRHGSCRRGPESSNAHTPSWRLQKKRIEKILPLAQKIRLGAIESGREDISFGRQRHQKNCRVVFFLYPDTEMTRGLWQQTCHPVGPKSARHKPGAHMKLFFFRFEKKKKRDDAGGAPIDRARS